MHASFVASGREKVARFLAVNALLFALFDLAGAGVWFFRCLAGCDGELAVAGDAHPQYRRARLQLKRRRPVQPRPDHTRKLDRAGLIAPYWVNYYAEHHLFMYLPCSRLA